MKRRKVITFYVLLFAFVFTLSYIEIMRFGSLTGFISRDDSNSENMVLSEKSYKEVDRAQRVSFYILVVLLFIFCVAFIVRYLYRHYEKTTLNGLNGINHKHKRLIPIELGA